jgi:hypothetical protein
MTIPAGSENTAISAVGTPPAEGGLMNPAIPLEKA